MGAAHSSGEATFDRVERDDNADVDISAELLHSLQEPEKSQSSDSAKSQPPPQTFTYTNSPPVDNAKEADLELMRENIEHLLKESKNEGIKEGRQILDSEETAVSQKAIDKIEEDATDKILSDELQAEQSLEKALNDFEVRHGVNKSREPKCKQEEAEILKCYRNSKTPADCHDLIENFTVCVDTSRKSRIQSS